MALREGELDGDLGGIDEGAIEEASCLRCLGFGGEPNEPEVSMLDTSEHDLGVSHSPAVRCEVLAKSALGEMSW